MRTIKQINKKSFYKGGQVVMIAVLIFTLGALVIVSGVVNPLVGEVSQLSNLVNSKKSFFTAESGMEDVVYRLVNNLSLSSVEEILLNGATSTVSINDLGSQKELLSVGDKNSIIRKVKLVLTEGVGISFNYGVQVGDGGLIFQNSSSVLGNVYSNGPISGTGNHIIEGDIISAGSGGLISGVHATGTAYANSISSATIDGDAYYQSISNTTVGGQSFPGSPDQPTQDLPIPDSKIEEWKADALSGGLISSPCPYEINSDTTLGPVKISCNLIISGNNPDITLMGNVWVSGDIDVKNSPNIVIDSSLGSKSVVIIADNPSDRITSSTIEIENSASFSGNPNSYILFVSQNNSSENGGDIKAIEVQNSVSGQLLIYAGHGEISLENNIDLKEVSGYKITLKNFTEIIYESGLANTLFSSGPGGGFTIDSWSEI